MSDQAWGAVEDGLLREAVAVTTESNGKVNGTVSSWGRVAALISAVPPPQVRILPNSRYPARTHSHSLIAYRMFGSQGKRRTAQQCKGRWRRLRTNHEQHGDPSEARAAIQSSAARLESMSEAERTALYAAA
eukprot:COSAG03_NODE_13112_length_516_cov_1.100719_1_plen_131_part_01